MSSGKITGETFQNMIAGGSQSKKLDGLGRRRNATNKLVKKEGDQDIS